MSTPHEITYTLTFHSETAAAEKTSSSGFDPMFMLLIGIVVLTAAAVFSLSATKKKISFGAAQFIQFKIYVS